MQQDLMPFVFIPSTFRQGLRVEINRDLDVSGMGRIAKGTTGTVVRAMLDATDYEPIAHVRLDGRDDELPVFRDGNVEDGEVTERVFDMALARRMRALGWRVMHDGGYRYSEWERFTSEGDKLVITTRDFDITGDPADAIWIFSRVRGQDVTMVEDGHTLADAMREVGALPLIKGVNLFSSTHEAIKAALLSRQWLLI
jgi:hypothetical protein